MDDEKNNTEKYITALTFTLNGEIFAIDIKFVREVLEYVKVTTVPKSPRYMLGVINLRGSVSIVVDLKTKFNMPQSDPTVDTCIIIVEVGINGSKTVIGILADSVKEVYDFEIGAIEEPPRLALSMETGFLKGFARQKDDFVMILDINKIFSPEELGEINMNREAEPAF